jgi:cyclic pyranopterin phosphate synthase
VRPPGGDPTLRRDLEQVVREVAAIDGIEHVALTTNGHDLEQRAVALRAAGLSSLNLSVDSLDVGRFAEITGRPVLDRVLRGIDAALAAGFSRVKVNAVLLRTVNDGELTRFLEWTRVKPIAVRFIELMRCGNDAGFFERHHLAAPLVEDELTRRGWRLRPRRSLDGPAREFTHGDHVGDVGIIAPYAKDFCATCNRIRVTSRGALRLCLFGEREDVPLRHLLRDDSQRAELVDAVAAAVRLKPGGSGLGVKPLQAVRSLATVGG